MTNAKNPIQSLDDVLKAGEEHTLKVNQFYPSTGQLMRNISKQSDSVK